MTGTQRPLPAQLPHQIPDFTGRDAELDRLDALVTGDRGEHRDERRHHVDRGNRRSR